MKPLSAFLARLRGADGEREFDFALELDAHIQMLTEDNIRAGFPPEEARRLASITMGGAEQIKEECRDRWSFPWLASLRRDLGYGVRVLAKSPTFTTTAILTLALGIGATTAIFTLIDAVLLKSLPVRDPGGLVVLGDGSRSGVGVGIQGSYVLYSWDLYKHLRNTNLFESLCAVQSSHAQASVRRARSGIPQPVTTKLVSGNYFEALGVKAALGRTIAPSDDAPSAPPVAIVSDRYWKESLNGDASAIGSVVDVNRVPVEIVGVAPPEFFGETLQPDPPAFWLPVSAQRQLDPESNLIDAPDENWLYLVGRLKPNLAPAQAQARLTQALRSWLLSREGSSISEETRREISKSYIELTPGGSGIAHMRQYYSQTLALLLGISAVVLLITCANIANLLLARGAARTAESSVRLALGASRRRLVRQSLTESLTLALCAGTLGLLIASAGTKLLLAIAFRGTGYIPIQTTPDIRVLAFTFSISCAAALVFGLQPAIRMSSEIAPTIRSAGRRTGLSGALIVGQVALSLVVLAGAGSFARSLANLTGQQFGFDRERVLVLSVDSEHAGYEYNRLGPLYRQILSRLNALAGVKSASLSYYSPFNGCCWDFSIAVDGYIPKPEEKRNALLNRVSPRYFETLGTKLLQGRTIDERDTPATERVAVVTQEFVRHFFPNENPIGKRIGIGDDRKGRGNIEIVGVVENAKYSDPGEEPPQMAFLPLLQVTPGESASATGEYGSNFIGTIEVRSAGNPGSVAGLVRQALAEIDPGLPVLRVDTLADHVDRTLNQQNVIADLAGFFGLLALVLTCVGLYGLTAWMVQRRTSEIGLRVALGARRSGVVGMILREGLVQCAVGILIGVPAAFAATRLAANQLYGIGQADPKSSVLAAFVLLVFITIAGYLPARRATRIDPMAALRYE